MSGRPNAFTPERAARAIEAIRKGNTRACAAKGAGVALSVLMEWIQKARAGDPAFAEFAEQIVAADYEAESEMVDVVRNAAKSGNYQAALEWLGRQRRGKWAKNEAPAVNIGHLHVRPAQAKAIEAEDAEWEPLQLEEPKKENVAK